MLLNILRAIFLLLISAVAVKVAEYTYTHIPAMPLVFAALGVAALLILTDVLIPQKSLAAMSAVFFGLLLGLLISYVASYVINPLLHSFRGTITSYMVDETKFESLVSTVNVGIAVVSCYMAISFILQTRDDIRFVIPYVEFAKERKGQHPLILDTSVIIDGRIADILKTWVPDAPVIVPPFVLQELQTIADSNDKLKRNRGRRGLDIVNKLQSIPGLDVQFQDARMTREEAADPVDQRLVTLARKIDGRIVTNDYNLNKVAQIGGVEVLNINDLANALKPVFLPGEPMQVKIIKPGEEAGQGVGYLEDGTMVVVEAAREKIGETIPIVVTSVLQTSAGRMVFGRAEGAPGPDRGPRRRGSHAQT
jgi:uncharacterized protein YacL